MFKIIKTIKDKGRKRTIVWKDENKKEVGRATIKEVKMVDGRWVDV
jgi:hypothetical protein